jgi:hypothetical protein
VAPLDVRYDLSGTPVEIFRQLRPGEPVPAELAALAWPARGDGVSRASRPAPEHDLTASAFSNKYCTTSVITHQVVPGDLLHRALLRLRRVRVDPRGL